jgi:hypothetical protein
MDRLEAMGLFVLVAELGSHRGAAHGSRGDHERNRGLSKIRELSASCPSRYTDITVDHHSAGVDPARGQPRPPFRLHLNIFQSPPGSKECLSPHEARR